MTMQDNARHPANTNSLIAWIPSWSITCNKDLHDWMHLSSGEPYGHPTHEVASLRIFGSRKSWSQRWNGLDE
jgi:hypothetical protein